MREIKFRAYKKSWGIMVTPDAIEKYLNDQSGIYGIEWINKTSDGEEKEEWIEEGDNDVFFMQFTGLRDRNGKDIYEGDIVKCLLFKGDNYTNTYIVEFNILPAPMFMINGRQMNDAEYEIIGNVWQNPELITPNQ